MLKDQTISRKAISNTNSILIRFDLNSKWNSLYVLFNFVYVSNRLSLALRFCLFWFFTMFLFNLSFLPDVMLNLHTKAQPSKCHQAFFYFFATYSSSGWALWRSVASHKNCRLSIISERGSCLLVQLPSWCTLTAYTHTLLDDCGCYTLFNVCMHQGKELRTLCAKLYVWAVIWLESWRVHLQHAHNARQLKLP